ncbi:MAG: DNA polymerase I [Armatimonadetes bacterium]|nr:DNA polymerase I [Armatimonadota bacterium]
MSQPKRLFLLDGMAILFRGYFALMNAHLTARNGEPTGGTFAFVTALISLLEEEEPDLIAVAWDTAEPTFRHIQFADYKAHRPEFPPEMIPQLARVKEIVKLFHIPCLEMPGFEADDIIGTLARRAEADGYQVYCVTPDKDYLQLVSDRVVVYKPTRPGGDPEVVGIDGVIAKFGVPPERVIDVLALMGDSSDNVPGVKGIGEKTAIPLIQQYGTIEGLYEAIETVEKAGTKKKLIENRDNAFLSKELVTIHTSVPVEVSYQDLHLDPPDTPALIALFTELGFKSLAKRFQEQQAALESESESGTGTPAAAPVAADRSAAEASPTKESAAASPEKNGVTAETSAASATAQQPPIADHQAPQTIASVPHTYHIVRTMEELGAMVTELASGPMVAFDLETDSLDWAKASILGLSFSATPHHAFYVPIAQSEITHPATGKNLFDLDEKRGSATEGIPLDDALGVIGPLLENPSIPKCGQNAKFDMAMLQRHGVVVANLAVDSMVASYVLDSTQSHGMDALSERFLRYRPVPITDLIGTGRDQTTLREVPMEAVAEYAAEDADITLQLCNRLTHELRQQNLEEVATRFDFPLVTVLTAMETQGVFIDVPALKEISSSLDQIMERLQGEIFEMAGHPFTINSPKQLADILFVELKLPTKKKTKTGYSTDQFVMEELAALHPLPEKVLEYRQAAKLKGTYVDALPSLINPRTGRIHTSYHQAVTSTGRLSSNNPNVQNIPIRSEMGQEIRKAFTTDMPDGVMISADYSQIELRIMAHICGDEALVRAFQENFDIHTATASNVFNVAPSEVTPNMRRRAKEVNFGIMYGIGPFGLARRLKISKTEAAELIRTYFEKYPGVQGYIGSTLEKARTLGYVETLSGRRRHYPNINSSNPTTRGAEERAAINMPIQGCASDIIKLAMIDIHRQLPAAFPDAAMLLQVHDELVFEAPASQAEAVAAFVKETMETCFPLDPVPMVVETGIGKNWYQAH